MDQRAFYRRLVERYVSSKASRQELDLFFRLMEDEEFSEVMSEVMEQHLVESLQKGKQAKLVSLRRRRYGLAGIAASLILMISISGLYFLFSRNEALKSEEVVSAKADPVNPGDNQAVLTLSNGKRIILKEQNNGLLAREGGLSVYKSKEGVLVYKAEGSVSSRPNTYNTISTPRGGQYQLVLEDGSKIWLNASSSIKFPGYFGTKQRRIEVIGEVYCEISKDPKRPFIVSFGKQEVEVLGTHFNIDAYPDEGVTRTTLLEGSIKLGNTETGQSRLLVPGEQGRMDKGNNQLNIEHVNTELAVAWKEGYFIFNQEPLESIMRKVSRWYNVEVIYKNGIPHKRFGGKISKFEDMQELLDVLAATGSVKFETKGRRVIVTN